MALSDLQVYSEYAYEAFTEVLAQQVDLFNAASGGAITLRGAAHQGDFNEIAFFQKVSGLVRRRNAYGAGAVAEKVLKQIADTMVKVAAGTPPVRIDPGQFRWIQQNPQIAGVILGQQLAKDTLGDMLNIGLAASVAALSQTAATKFDATGLSAPADKWSFLNQNNGQALFGDAAQSIVAWVTHSKPVFDLYANALTNNEKLFTFGNVNVQRDPFGRLMLLTDSPSLVTAGSPNVYHNVGLSQGGLIVDMNNDFDANEHTANGDENITRTYQAEWSYNLGIKGYSWDKTNGGKSPNDAAIATATNWDQYSTSIKDVAGVVVNTH